MKVSLTFILVLGLTVFLATMAMPAEKSSAWKQFKGYLSDMACGTSSTGKAADGTDMVNSPQNHTAACMAADSCAASGYGVMIKGKSGKYSFVKFDSNGDTMAKEILKNTRKDKGLLVLVKGKMDNNMIAVSSIKELSMSVKKGKKS